jgi:asparagine synthase (glutamine-hydrolysing)
MDAPAIVQFAFSTPGRLRLRGDVAKYIHVNALRELVPARVLNRKSKADFGRIVRQPLDRLQDWFGAVASSKYPEILDKEGLAKLFRYYQANPQAGWPMWVLWMIYGSQEFRVQRDSSALVFA